MNSPIADIAEFAKSLPQDRSIFGLDLGTKTIGVAVSDTGRIVASPLVTLKRKNFRQDAAKLLEIAAGREVAGMVIGLPINMDGSEGPRCQACRAFAGNLKRITDLPVTYWDERLSSVAAERALLEAGVSRKRRAEVIDKVAASYILQGALDHFSHLRVDS